MRERERERERELGSVSNMMKRERKHKEEIMLHSAI